MKQVITAEQLQELSEEQKERLRDWWEVQEGDRFFAKGLWEDIAGKSGPGCVENFDCEGLSYKKENCLPLLSVGQCIELLHGKFAETISIEYSKHWDQWFVSSDRTDEPETEAGEIIDALWEAVKAVL